MIMVVTVFVVVVAMLVIMPMIMFVRMLLAVFVRMIMLMAVIVIMIVLMTVIVFVVMTVFVIMLAMRMRLGGLIGAALRLERRLHHFDRGAEAARHLLQHGIAGDADAVGEQLGRDMAVAEMPGEARQMMRVARDDLRHRLLGGDHRDRASVLERNPVILLQPGGFRQVEQEHHVALAAHGDAPAVAPVMGQHHAVGGGGDIPGSGGQERTGTDHGETPVEGMVPYVSILRGPALPGTSG